MWYPVIDGLPLRLWVRLPHHTLCAAPAALQRKQAQISGGDFAVCSEAFAAALIWVGVSRIFFTYQVAYCSGFPLSLYTV